MKKRSDNIESLKELKNRKIDKIFKKQQGMQDQHVIMLTTLVKQKSKWNSKKNKKFYSFIKHKAKESDIVGASPLLDSEGVTHISDNKLSKLLSDQFASVFTCDDGLTPEVQGLRGPMNDDIAFTTNGFVKLIKDLNSENASGSDEMSAWVLK